MLGLLKSEDDEFDAYSKMLATKFRKISELDRRAFLNVQRKINDTVLDEEISLLN